MGKKKSNHHHRSQDVQEETHNHSNTDSHHHKQNQKSAAIKRRQSRDSEMRSKTSSVLITNSEGLSQTANGEDESTGITLSLPPQNHSSDHLSHNSDVNHKNKKLNESHDKNKQHHEAAETSSSKREHVFSPMEASSDLARHDRESTPLATNANPRIIVGESDDGEFSSGHSTPVPKPGYNDSYEIDIMSMSPATSTSTLTTIGIHSPPECNGHSDATEQHYRRQPPKLRTDAEVEGGMHTDYRDKYYNSSKHNLQPPHEQKFKKRGSGEFQSLKELDETNSLPYNFNASPNQINVHELSQVDHYSQSSLPRLGAGKKRTSLGDFYNSQESPPSPRHFLSQSVMSQSVIELSEQDEIHLSQMSGSNLSRMASEPYLYNNMFDNNAKYQHPSNYRYSSGSAYSHVVPYSGSRQGNTSRNRHVVKNRERIPGRRHSGDNTHHLAAGDKSNSTSSLSQPRRG